MSFISNKTFHFSAFPPSDVQLRALKNFRVESYRFRKIAQNVIFGPPDLKMHESASHHFAWTLPAQPRQTWRLQPGNQIQTACRAQTAWPGPTRLTPYRKRWTAISSHFSVAVNTKTWKLAAHADEAWLAESSVDRCRSEADVQQQAIAKCRLYFSTKCVKMRICNKIDVSFHHFNEFRLQSWSFLYSEFIQDAQRTHSICRIHLFEQFTNLHIWIENLILFHRSVIWAENCHKWITTSNKWFHVSVFSSFRTFSFSADHFRHENY